MESFTLFVSSRIRSLLAADHAWKTSVGWPAKIGGVFWLVGVIAAEGKLLRLVLCGMFAAFVVEQVRLIRMVKGGGK